MPFGRGDSRAKPGPSLRGSELLLGLRLLASAAGAILIVALLAMALGPKDGGTLTLYGLVIAVNLLMLLAYWLLVIWLRRRGQE